MSPLVHLGWQLVAAAGLALAAHVLTRVVGQRSAWLEQLRAEKVRRAELEEQLAYLTAEVGRIPAGVESQLAEVRQSVVDVSNRLEQSVTPGMRLRKAGL